MKINIPELSLVVLVGSSGSGKSTFARQHFGRFEVVSSTNAVALSPMTKTAWMPQMMPLSYSHYVVEATQKWPSDRRRCHKRTASSPKKSRSIGS